MADDLTAEFAREILDYDPETGALTWRAKRGRVAKGCPVRSPTHDGYLRVSIHGKKYRAHRIAWLIHHGAWPSGDIDHINGNPLDNRLINLRDVTHQQNIWNSKKPRNNTTGRKGVVFDKYTGRYIAQICVDKKRRTIGRFDTIEQAAIAYAEASKELHGNFGRTG